MNGQKLRGAAGALLSLFALTTLPGPARAGVGPLRVVSLEKIGETRVDRTTYDYTYRVHLRNEGSDAAANVNARLTGAPAGTAIVDGKVVAGTIAAGATVAPADQIVLRINRTIAFQPEALVWDIQSIASVQLDPVKPAEVVVLSLAELGFPNGADSVTVTGAVSDVLLKDGTLRFSTPGDTGVDQHAQFQLVHGGGAATLDLVIKTGLPTSVVTYIEPLDDGSFPQAPPLLSIGGLGPNNLIKPGALTFKVDGTEGLDLRDDSNGLITGPNQTAISLKQYWTRNPDGAFVIDSANLGTLLNNLPNGLLNVGLNFVSKDGEFAVNYDFNATKAAARMTGKLVASGGAALPQLAGRKVLLRGYNSHYAAVATVDAAGQFVFDNVIPDTYQLTLSDLDHPNVVSISALVFDNSSTVNVTLVYPFAVQNKGSKLAATAAGGAPYSAGSVRQNGDAPAARPAMRGGAPAAAKSAAAVTAAGATFTAAAAAQNQTITTPIAFTVPKDTKNVGVKVTVFSEEYPEWTTKQSQYNDTWSYSVVGLPGSALSAAGSVNLSHYTQGTVTKTSCVDVTSLAKNNPFDVTGAVSATNIGDSALPTVTTVELTVGCVGLKVTSAKFLSPNKDAHPVLDPIKVPGNLAGPYISVAEGAGVGTHTVPLEVEYSPADADITEVNIGISADGDPLFATENLLGQTATKTPGKIKFPGLVLPAFAGQTSGKVVLTVRLTGKVEDVEVTTDPAEGGQVAFKGGTAFTPLYLANDTAGLGGARRYGTRDAGGDSWATRAVIDWLGTKPYRFDDISGQHITQTAAGRSILDHSGHSDGQQIDMRYADGQGGYSDTLGGQGNGAGIKALFDAAAAEVAANLPQKPKLAALVAWITANRALLDAESADAGTRVIYIGPKFVKLALVDGMFSVSPAVAIPGVSAWTMPANVKIDSAHLSHWHLSKDAHP